MIDTLSTLVRVVPSEQASDSTREALADRWRARFTGSVVTDLPGYEGQVMVEVADEKDGWSIWAPASEVSTTMIDRLRAGQFICIQWGDDEDASVAEVEVQGPYVVADFVDGWAAGTSEVVCRLDDPFLEEWLSGAQDFSG